MGFRFARVLDGFGFVGVDRLTDNNKCDHAHAVVRRALDALNTLLVELHRIFLIHLGLECLSPFWDHSFNGALCDLSEGTNLIVSPCMT
jgi:hypothetical protein